MVIAIAAAAIIIAAVLVLCILTAVKTYNVTCYHSDEAKARHSNPHIELGQEQYKDISPIMHSLISAAEAEPCEEVSIKASADGIGLFGRLYKFSDSNTVNIFFHGYRGTSLRDGCGGFEMSKNLGINLLMVDQRANGRSDGHAITFGVLEQYDCRDWVNFIIGRFGPDVKIVLSGVSLGAATVLTASGLDMPKNVKCIIADCGFTSPKAIICKVASESGYPAELCYPLLNLCCRIRDGFDLNSASAIDSVRKTNIPILIIHGDDDRYVPYEMAEELYNACASEKKLLRVHGAPHAASYIIDKKAYTDASVEFIRKYCGEI